MKRRSHHYDPRGNTHDRRVRRQWLIRVFGNGRQTVTCYHCKRRVRVFDVDRFPVCGHDGGRYTRDNIVPSCPRCNRRRCARCRR